MVAGRRLGRVRPADARDSLTRSTAALTEIDALLDQHYDDLRTRAEAAKPGEMLLLDDYPITIELSPDDVLRQSRDELRVSILDRSADRLYDDGTGVLRDTTKGQGDIGTFSVAGITDNALGVLTSSSHTRFAIAMAVLLAIAMALIATTAAACRGWGRIGAVGLVLLLASLAVAGTGLVVTLYANAADGSANEHLRQELMAVIEKKCGAIAKAG